VGVGAAIAQAVSHQRPNFDSKSGDVGFMVDKVVLALVCSEYFGSPCQFSLHQMLHIYISSGDGEMGTLMTGVPSGLSLIPVHELKKGANQNYIRQQFSHRR
jgi:hypothetical protein